MSAVQTSADMERNRPAYAPVYHYYPEMTSSRKKGARCGICEISEPVRSRNAHKEHSMQSSLDAVIPIGQTSALEPLETGPLWETQEPVPEPYASGLCSDFFDHMTRAQLAE